ncbi:MAG: helix-turn-helix transcriptional regulator [Clostridia bacterium]|nr:helix-turn-helix transcriptional regulator [Clostridia bacterium]
MKLSLINPYIRLARESRIRSGHNIARRVIYDYEIIYLEEGQFTLIYNDLPYECYAGDLIFIRPGVPHSFVIDRGEISQPHIHFDVTYRPQSERIPISFKDFCRMSEEERSLIHEDYFVFGETQPKLYIREKEQFLGAFYRIISAKDDQITSKAALTWLISMIIKDNYPKALEEQHHPSTMRQIKDYIDAGNGLSMTLDDFAGTFFYNKYHLERKFKAKFGVSLIEYRNEKRLESARSLLESNSVSSVAQALGYSSIYSFSRAYKQKFGYSPSAQKSRNIDE